MHQSIGKQLGVLLAQYERELYDGGDNLDCLEKTKIISDIYRNFIEAGKKGFEEDFELGYEEEVLTKSEVKDPSPSSEALLGDYLAPVPTREG